MDRHPYQKGIIEKHLQGLGLNNYELVKVPPPNSDNVLHFDFNLGANIDLALIDGDHSYEGVKKDGRNIMKYLYL